MNRRKRLLIPCLLTAAIVGLAGCRDTSGAAEEEELFENPPGQGGSGAFGDAPLDQPGSEGEGAEPQQENPNQ